MRRPQERGSMDGVAIVVLVVVLGLVGAGLAGVWVVLVQVVTQQGRILLRLDELAQNGHALHALNGHIAQADQLPVIAAPVQPPGLPVGTPIGDFQLPDLSGRLIGSAAWRGKRTLLIHWSTTCGFCDLIAPELAQLDVGLRKQQVRLVLGGSPTSMVWIAQSCFSRRRSHWLRSATWVRRSHRRSTRRAE